MAQVNLNIDELKGFVNHIVRTIGSYKKEVKIL